MRKVLVICVLICLSAANVLPAGYHNSIEVQAESTEMNNQCNDNSDFSVDWWPMFHHDLCHTGFSTSSAPETNRVKWTYTTGDWVESSPAISNGKVYIGSGDGKIYCFEDNPPLTPDTPSGPQNVKVNEAHTYTACTTDPDGDDIYYLFDWGDGNTSGWLGPYESGEEVQASHLWSERGVYEVKVKAKDIYGAESDWSNPLIVNVEFHPPLTPDAPSGPQNVNVGEVYTYTACTTDPDGDDIYYLFDWDDDTTSDWLGPYESGEEVQANHSWSKKGTYEVRVKAKDIYGAESDWSDPLIVNVENAPPFTPGTPSGEQYAQKNQYYSYTARTVDPDGDMVYYLFDWDDGSDSGWIGPYESGEEITADHLWSKKGTYKVRVKAKDIYGAESDWSDNLTVNVENRPPLKPSKPSGPEKVKVGKYYKYTARTTDPDGDDIYYKFDWGDGDTSDWLGPKKSGETITAEHSWSEKGTYEVRVKAKDIYGAESEWSDNLTVKKSKSFCSFWFLQWLIDHFPLLAKFLKIALLFKIEET